MSSDARGSTEHVSQYNEAVRASRCHFCPATHNLQTHHIVPQRKNGSDQKENLVIVCERCHKKLESLYDQRFYEQLGLSDDKGEERTHFSCLITDCREAATAKVESGYGSVNWFCDNHAANTLIETDVDDDWEDRVLKYVGDDYKQFKQTVHGKEFADYRSEVLDMEKKFNSIKGAWNDE